MTEHVLDHEPPDPRTSVHRGQDEERLEQDREVVPERFHRLAAHGLTEDLRHAYRERGCPTGARKYAAFTDVLRSLRDHVGRDHETPVGDHLCCVGGSRTDDGCGAFIAK
jgi:hypothetical protein